MSMNTAPVPLHGTSSRLRARLRRLGIGGFVFFFAKGMLWLAVPAVVRLLG